MRKKGSSLFVYIDEDIDRKDIVLDIVRILLPSDQEIVRKKCGPNYDGENTSTLTKEETARFFSVIKPRIRNGLLALSKIEDKEEYSKELEKLRISFTRIKKMNSVSNLLGYFNNLYSYEELDAVIKTLKDEEQRGIYAVCGVLLNGENTKEDTLSKEERGRVNTHYLPKVKSRLKKLYPDRVVKEDSVVEVTTPVVKETTVVSNEELTKPLGVVVKDEIGFTKEDYLDIVKIFNSEEFKELMRLNLPLEEIIVASLIHHGFKGKRFTIEDLERFLGVSREVIMEIARKSTEEYRKAINERIDEYENNLLKLMINNDGVK